MTTERYAISVPSFPFCAVALSLERGKLKR